MNKELKIQIPEGYVVDEKNSTFKNIIFKPISGIFDDRPRTWSDYVEQQRQAEAIGYALTSHGDIICQLYSQGPASRTTLPTRDLAIAFCAMIQLMSLRNAWIGTWEPDWKDEDTYKYTITSRKNKIELSCLSTIAHPLSFPTRRMAEDFQNRFADIIEQAKLFL